MAARFQNHLETYGVAPPPSGVPEQIILPPGSVPR
jgi:hypothetical protein